MRWHGPTVLLVELAAAVVVERGWGQASGSDQLAEPPMLLTLEFDGSRHSIEFGKPLTLETKEGKTVLLLRAEDYRVFPYAGLRFRYPAHFAFEADLDNPDVEIWSLDGNEVVLMVQRFPGETDHELYRRQAVQGTAGHLGLRRPRTTEKKVKLGGRELSGTRMDVAIGTTRLTMDFYSLVLGRSSVVILLQDTSRPDGSPSAEYEGAFKMLAESFELSR